MKVTNTPIASISIQIEYNVNKMRMTIYYYRRKKKGELSHYCSPSKIFGPSFSFSGEGFPIAAVGGLVLSSERSDSCVFVDDVQN